MLKLQTPVDLRRSAVLFSYESKIMVLGSCFADNAGRRMKELGFDVLTNPFGTLYNPLSIVNSIGRMAYGKPFGPEECVQMGAGANLVCSFSHHTSFARKTEEEFLSAANEALAKASAFWNECKLVIITLGTSWCWNRDGITVSNCLKRPASEFQREFLPSEQTETVLRSMVKKYPDKKFIFTVSPIRHMADGAHGNQLSKSALLLAAEAMAEAFPEQCAYFPAYELMMDELRDYRWYAEDMVHPSAQAEAYIWERFCDFALEEKDRPALEESARAFKRSQHRDLH